MSHASCSRLSVDASVPLLAQTGLQGMAPGGMPLVPDTASEIIQQIQYLRQRVHDAGEDYEKMKQEQESFAIQYHECAKLNGKLPRGEVVAAGAGSVVRLGGYWKAADRQSVQAGGPFMRR